MARPLTAVVLANWGQRVYVLPQVRDPVLTALFERILREVETGKVPLDVFIEKQKQLVINELRRLRK